jgi:RND family efflux transporter MFP subunit
MTDQPQAPQQHDPAPEPSQTSSPKKRGWAGRVFGVLVLLALAGGLGFGALRYTDREKQVMADAQHRQDFAPTLRVVTVEPSSESVVVSLPATTAAFTTANIFARASGYISKRIADIGDNFKAGDLLAEITAPELDHQIAQAQATLGQTQAAINQAQANLELARVTWERDRPLVTSGWTSAQQGTIDVQNVRGLEAALGVAQANLAAQQQQIQVLSQQKDYQRVVAPFDGTISVRNIDTGSLVQADATSGTFMYTMIQANVIRTQVYVPQDHAFGLEPGVDAVIKVPEIPNRTFPGKVTRIADALQPGTRTLLTEIDIPNPDGALSPGVYCTVELHIPRKSPSLIVPSDAIIFNAGGMQVAIAKDGVASLRKIVVGRDFGKTVEVRDGLKAGDQVIINAPVDLAEGSKVDVKPVESASK